MKLLVGLDGESQGNIYQDTLAKLMMNFAVEDNSNPTSQKSTYIYNYNEQGEDRRYLVNSVSCSVCDWYYFDDTGFRK